MKYIRTKDELGILVENTKEIKNKYGDYLKKGCYFKTWFSPNTNREDIIKQADTIDKLCDTFVICIDKQGYLIIDDYKKAMEIMQRNDDDNAICYGAIWCEWGLKYVAKMNKKVEMELL